MTTPISGRVYVPKTVDSLPKGRLTLYLSENRHFIGRDTWLGVRLAFLPKPPLTNEKDNENYPILNICAEIFIETEAERKASLKGTKIGWITGWVVQKSRIANEGEDFW
jgi:hypothetical protein